jgi:hypothetical protein
VRTAAEKPRTRDALETGKEVARRFAGTGGLRTASTAHVRRIRHVHTEILAG